MWGSYKIDVEHVNIIQWFPQVIYVRKQLEKLTSFDS